MDTQFHCNYILAKAEKKIIKCKLKKKEHKNIFLNIWEEKIFDYSHIIAKIFLILIYC